MLRCLIALLLLGVSTDAQACFCMDSKKHSDNLKYSITASSIIFIGQVERNTVDRDDFPAGSTAQATTKNREENINPAKMQQARSLSIPFQSS